MSPSKPQPGCRAVLLALTLTLAGCSAQRAFWDAESLKAKGQEREALAKYEQAWRAQPSSGEYRTAYLQTRDRLVNEWQVQGETLALEGNLTAAEQRFRQVLAVVPTAPRALAGLRNLERSKKWAQWLADAQGAIQRKDWDSAAQRLKAILQEQPDHMAARQLLPSVEERISQQAPESSLAYTYRKPVSLEFRDAPLRSVFDALSRSSGLNFVFDRELRMDGRVTIFLRDTTLEAALNSLFASQQLDGKVLNSNSMFVYANTPAKQKEHQTYRVRSYYLANADAKSVAATLKTMARVRDVVIDEKLNLLMVRDTPEALKLVDKLVALHDVPEAEVMLEVEVLEVKRSRLLDLGVRWPDQLTLSPLASGAGGALTLADLRNLDSTRIGAALGSISLGANQTDTDANILANPRIRTKNREKARVLIGERVPNITSTATSTGFVSESINYIDVGLKLEAEPTIFSDGEVSIRLALEVSNIIGQVQTKGGSLAYQIGTRSAQTVLRLKDGENQILAGLINDEERNSANKVPVVGGIPLLGRLFGRHSDTATKTEIVLSITPRLVRGVARLPASMLDFEAGTESSPAARSAAAGSPASYAPDGSPSRPTSGSGPILLPMPSPAPAEPAPIGSNAGGSAPSASDARNPNSTATPEAAAAPAQGPILSWQAPASVQVGDEFTAMLLLQSAAPLVAAAGQISFDPKRLQLIAIAEGDALRQDGAPTQFDTTATAPGSARWTLKRQAPSTAKLRTNGPLVHLRLRALPGTGGDIRVDFQGVDWMGIDDKPVVLASWPPLLLRLAP